MKLIVPKLAVHAVGLEQFGVRAALDGLAVTHDDDFIHLDHRCQAVGREDHGTALGDLEQRAVDRRFRGLIEG